MNDAYPNVDLTVMDGSALMARVLLIASGAYTKSQTEQREMLADIASEISRRDDERRALLDALAWGADVYLKFSHDAFAYEVWTNLGPAANVEEFSARHNGTGADIAAALVAAHMRAKGES